VFFSAVAVASVFVEFDFLESVPHPPPKAEEVRSTVVEQPAKTMAATVNNRKFCFIYKLISLAK
jgi:hypothetical protein